MRLIDADLLKQNCKCTGGFKDNFMCVDLITLAQVIDNQPTALDTEKVVEKLEELADESYKAYCIAFNSDDRAEYDAYTNAIEIVKGGGVNE